jgi:hypothetical protein
MVAGMRSKELNLSAYDTDKIKLRYLEEYDPVLAPWVDKDVKLLEIGVDRGGSLKLWHDYFARATIVGIDRKLPQHFEYAERILLFQGNQKDRSFLSQVANTTAPEGFDIIIDDGSHIGEATQNTFWHLFDHHLKPGGLYAIEDWGTGYLDDFPDGRKFNSRIPILHRVRSLLPKSLRKRIKLPFPCHAYGMVGFVKQLVDEQGAASIAAGCKTGWRRSKFNNLLITPGIVFVFKAAPTLDAHPNPVLTNDLGKTTISWRTSNGSAGRVCVSVDGHRESLFAKSHQGTAVADWIRPGHVYEFRLYESDDAKTCAKVVVTTAGKQCDGIPRLRSE